MRVKEGTTKEGGNIITIGKIMKKEVVTRGFYFKKVKSFL